VYNIIKEKDELVVFFRYEEERDSTVLCGWKQLFV